MTQVGETEVVAGNVRDIVNRLSRDMTGRSPYSVHQQVDRRPTAPSSSQHQTPVYVGTYPYNATQPDELSFVVGDIIELINEVEDGWSRGRLKTTGAVGMFPTNFVTLKPVATSTNSGPAQTTASTSGSRPKTAASEVVMRNEPKAIERTPSTILSDQAPVPKAIETKTSAFAASAPEFVSTEAAAAESGKTKEMARVKFVYVPQHGDELALGEIDVLINITNKNCGDAGWFEGELHGKKGLFPDNFVELVQVPLKTESGAKWGSISRQTALNFTSHKPPPVNPPQPAVPPKPAKIMSVDSSFAPTTTAVSASPAPATTTSAMLATTSSTPLKNNFAALREKMFTDLKVVAPEQVASVQLKPSEQRDRAASMEVPGEVSADVYGSGDQFTELQHITKNRARPPKSRPMSMVMNRNRSSEESPSGRLSSPTSAPSINPMSASMFIPPAAKEINIPSSNTPSPFKSAPPASVVPPSSATKPALRPVISNSLAETESHSRKLASPEGRKSTDFSPSTSSDFVSRAEYDALLERFRALESRVIALEKLRL